MDGDRLCCSEFFCFPLSFNFCAVCYSNDKYFYGAVRLLTWKPRTGFLFLKVFLHFFFHHEKFFFKHFSTYTDLKILKFYHPVCYHPDLKICNCLYEMKFFSLTWR